jgi:hypothetical protein
MRKAFNFFRSYYEIASELSDKDRLAFYDALMLEQFTGQKTELKGLAKFAYISQSHSINAQINGYNQRLKRTDIETNEEPLLPNTLSGLDPAAGGEIGAVAQEEGKEKEKEEEKEEYTLDNIRQLFISKTQYNWQIDFAKKEAEKFYNFYESKNWLIGKNKMKSVTHAIANWILRVEKPVLKNAPRPFDPSKVIW